VLAAILTVGVIAAFTFIVIVFAFAEASVAQFAFEINTQVTKSPFAKVVEAKVVASVPTFAPFTFHW
jgi:hypothetical protein